MSDLTTELNLVLATDNDDLADYLDAPSGSLRTSLITVDSLFSTTTGHTHNGAHQGGPIGSISAGAIPDGSVTASKLAPGAVGTTQLADGGVTSAKIADATITGVDIAASTITGANIAASTISGANIAASTITGGHIVDGSIGPGDIAAGAIGNAQLASGVVDSRVIADGSIQGADIAAGVITGAHIADGSITGADIAANVVLNDPRILGEGPTYTTGNYDLGAPTAGKWRFVKAWGGAVTLFGSGSGGLAAPGGTAIVASFVIQNGDSVSMYADGTYWWCI